MNAYIYTNFYLIGVQLKAFMKVKRKTRGKNDIFHAIFFYILILAIVQNSCYILVSSLMSRINSNVSLKTDLVLSQTSYLFSLRPLGHVLNSSRAELLPPQEPVQVGGLPVKGHSLSSAL